MISPDSRSLVWTCKAAKMKRRSAYYLFRIVAVLAVAGCTLFYLWNIGGYSLLLVALLWGIGSAQGMDNAIRSASASGLEYPKPSSIRSAIGHCILWGTFLAPAVIAIALGRPIASLCLALSIMIVMAVTFNISTWLLGPRVPAPNQN